MRSYQHYSIEALKKKRENLLEYIAEQEDTLANTKSKLLQLVLLHYIKSSREEVHAIDAELCYRNANHKTS